MNEDFVSYETAQALKRAGFDWPCRAYYAVEPDGRSDLYMSGIGAVRSFMLKGRDILAPSLYEAQKWLICKGVFVEVSYCGTRKPNPDGHSCKDVVYYELVNTISGNCIGDNEDVFEDYSTCLSAGIDAALNLIKEK